MLCVGYIRVSTDRQADDGAGLDVQHAALEQWAAAAGHTLIAVHRDEGISGAKDAADRPGLASALAAVEAGAQALVVPKLDRLARHLTVQEAVLAQVWRHGGRIFSVDLGEVLQDDPDDPMRTAMRQMVGVFAQLERAMIAARMRAGRRHKAEHGGYAGYGSPRLGQRALDGELVVDDQEQAVIGRIVELRREHKSLREIVAALEVEGLRPKRGGRWHPEVVRRTLARLDTAA